MTIRIKILALVGLGIIASAVGAMYAVLYQTHPPKNTVTTSSHIITTIEQNHAAHAPDVWVGTYVRKGSVHGSNATLTISEGRNTSFTYSIASSHGAHIGSIEATATSTGHDAASLIPDSPCTITLHKQDKTIAVRALDCGEFHGARAEFDGEYELGGTIRARTLEELGGESPVFRSPQEIAAFTRTIKPAYVDLYAESLVDVFEGEDMDAFDARVYRGSVPGLSTSMEAIIMIGEESGAIWAAVIQDDVVLYTTSISEYTRTLPKTIEAWRERFKDKRVVYLSAV